MKTTKRATAFPRLAAPSTEARPIVSNALHGSDIISHERQGIITLSGYGVAYPGMGTPVLSGVDLRITAGACHLLTGATGSGKSTLVLGLKGLLPQGSETGEKLGSGQGSTPLNAIGLVLQNPETQLFATTIGEEVAFALENRGVDPWAMPERVKGALDAVGLDLPLDTPVAPLSMGQKYRVLMAAILVMEPELLILDEPVAQLDSQGLNEIKEVMARLLADGKAILICEHSPAVFEDVIDIHWHLEDGTLHTGSGIETPFEIHHTAQTKNAGKIILEARKLAAGTEHPTPLWDDATFTIASGDRVLVEGPNGSGKSTLLRLVAGLESPRSGSLKLFGKKPELKHLRGRVGFLFQNPQRQLFEDRVVDEVGFQLKRLKQHKKRPQEISDRVEEILATCGISELSQRSPHILSFGQKHLVALASVLAAEPELLLLDDPFAGLDHPSRKRIWNAINTWQDQSPERTIIWTSHHDEPGRGLATLRLRTEGGRIAAFNDSL